MSTRSSPLVALTGTMDVPTPAGSAARKTAEGSGKGKVAATSHKQSQQAAKNTVEQDVANQKLHDVNEGLRRELTCLEADLSAALEASKQEMELSYQRQHEESTAAAVQREEALAVRVAQLELQQTEREAAIAAAAALRAADEDRLLQLESQMADLQRLLKTAQQDRDEALTTAAAAQKEAVRATEVAATAINRADEEAATSAAARDAFTAEQSDLSSQLADLKVQIQSTGKLVSIQAKQLLDMANTENNRSESYMAAGQFAEFQKQTTQQLQNLQASVQSAQVNVKALSEAKERADAAAARRAEAAEVAKAESKLFLSLPAALGNQAAVIGLVKELAAAAAVKGEEVAVPSPEKIVILKAKRQGAKTVSCLVQMATAAEARSCLRVKRCLNQGAERVVNAAVAATATTEQGRAAAAEPSSPVSSSRNAGGTGEAAATGAASVQQQPMQKQRGFIFVDECLTKAEKAQREAQEELRQNLRKQGVAVAWRRGKLVQALQDKWTGAWRWVEAAAAAATTATATGVATRTQKVWVRKQG